MPTFFLRHRQPNLSEFMDDPDCDLAMLQNTYRQFDTVNGLISGWNRVYKRFIRPQLFNGASILDIGCGGGDLLNRLAKWAAQDGFDIEILGIEPDIRAIDFAQTVSFSSNVSVLGVPTTELIRAGRTFDIVVSNHVLHHLSDTELRDFLDDSIRLSRNLVVHNDIRRDDLAYLGFIPSHLIFRDSFIAADGLRSVQRSFSAKELAGLAGTNWSVHKLPLFRNVLVWESDET